MVSKKLSNSTMKVLVLTNQKGGVGKTAIACQFAYYLAKTLNLRVLFIDMDHQANASKALKRSNLGTISHINSSQLLTESIQLIDLEEAPFLIIDSHEELRNIEKNAAQHNEFANNLYNFISSVNHHFDICLIDTNPNPDIRMTASLIVSDFVLSPIQLNQEAIDGISALKNDLEKIQRILNPKLKFIGILPNLVEPTPFQKDNLKQLTQYFTNLMIPLGKKQFAAIPKGTAIAEAQSSGLPVWAIRKTSARNIWNQLKPIFDKIIKIMEIK